MNDVWETGEVDHADLEPIPVSPEFRDFSAELAKIQQRIFEAFFSDLMTHLR